MFKKLFIVSSLAFLTNCASYYASDYNPPKNLSKNDIEKHIAQCEFHAENGDFSDINYNAALMQADIDTPKGTQTNFNMNCSGNYCNGYSTTNAISSPTSGLSSSMVSISSAIALKKRKMAIFGYCLKTHGWTEKKWSEKETAIEGIFTRGAVKENTMQSKQ